MGALEHLAKELGGLPPEAREDAARAREALAEADAAARAERVRSAVGLYENAWRRSHRANEAFDAVANPDGDYLYGEMGKRAESDPRNADTDGDGVDDGTEIIDLGTDPTEPDPPDSDREELKRGTNPLLPEDG